MTYQTFRFSMYRGSFRDILYPLRRGIKTGQVRVLSTYNSNKKNISFLSLCIISIGTIYGVNSFNSHLFMDHSSESNEATNIDIVKYTRSNPGTKFIGKSNLVTQLFEKTILKDITFSSTFGCAVDVSGDLFVWDLYENPRKIVSSYKINKVAATKDKIYFLDNRGRVYYILAESKARKNEISNGNDTETKSWFQIPGLSKPNHDVIIHNTSCSENIIDIKAGLNHVVALTSKGNVYTLASSINGNIFGQLGLGYTHSHISPPAPNTFNKLQFFNYSAKSIVTGNNHTLVLTKNSEVFGFGENSFGQIGGDPCEVYSSPKIINVPQTKVIDNRHNYFDYLQVAAGGDTSLLLTEDEQGPKVYSLGFGLRGQLGNGFRHATSEPQLIKSLTGLKEYKDGKVQNVKIYEIGVAVGGSHAFAILDTSRKDLDKQRNVIREYPRDVLLWGSNVSGELNRIDGKKGSSAFPIHSNSIHGNQQLALTPKGKSSSGIEFEEKIIAGDGFTCIYAKKV